MNKRMMMQVAHTAMVRMGTFVSRLALVFLLGRTFTPTDFGAYALIASTLGFGVVVLGLNLSAYVYRVVPGQPVEKRVTVFKSALFFEVGLSALLVSVLLFSGRLKPFLTIFKAVAYEPAFVIGFVTLIAMIAVSEMQHYLLAKIAIHECNLLDFITQALWVLPLLILWKLGWAVTLQRLLYIQLGGVLVGLVYASCKIELREWWQAALDAKVVRDGLLFSVPLIIPLLSYNLQNLADRFLLSYYCSLHDVGIYSLAYAFFNSLYSVTAVVILRTPMSYVVEDHNCGNFAQRDRKLTYALKGALGIYSLSAGALLIFSAPILRLMARQDFMASRGVMPLLAIGWVMLVLAYPAHYLLMLENRTSLIMAIDVVGLAAGMGLDVLLIPRYSYYGAAIAAIVNYTVVAGLKHYFSRSWTSIRLGELFSLRGESEILFRYLKRKSLQQT
ncbi:MAG: lipopolysaccharide biosynthesis protein [Candidatus Acidiferrales bacterium]